MVFRYVKIFSGCCLISALTLFLPACSAEEQSVAEKQVEQAKEALSKQAERVEQSIEAEKAALAREKERVEERA